MRITFRHIGLYLLASAGFILSVTDVHGQGIDVTRGKQKHLFAGLSIQPAKATIDLVTDNSELSNIISTGKNTLSGSLEIGYQFSKIFGISSGIGLNNYSSSFSLAVYKDDQPGLKDDDNDTYTRIIEGKNVAEEQKISLLGIPVLFNIHIPVSRGFGFYLQPGVSFSFPITRTFESSGTFSYKGYYSTYSVLIENAGVQGFMNDQKTTGNGELEVKSFVPELLASAGFSITINGKIQFLIGAYYGRSLSDLYNYTVSSAYYLSTSAPDMKSLMEGSSKVTADAVGLKVAFRYFIK